mmetsp:Transcript_21775/g.43210  ORF Transcript_21775/g.43210 Transcript_21775/m.43210 type:complete len:107 (+) Transcript_21775:261-581(+)
MSNSNSNSNRNSKSHEKESKTLTQNKEARQCQRPQKRQFVFNSIQFCLLFAFWNSLDVLPVLRWCKKQRPRTSWVCFGGISAILSLLGMSATSNRGVSGFPKLVSN